jgi:hypothetical protein
MSNLIHIDFETFEFVNDKQLEAAIHLSKTKRGIVWWKVGEGKTRIAIVWAFNVTEHPNPLIICSPFSFRQWMDEIRLVGLEGVFKPSFFSSGMLSTKRGSELLSRLLANEEAINCVIVDELWAYKNIRTKRSFVLSQLTKQFPTIGLSGSMVTARNIEDLYGQAFAVGLGPKVAPNITRFRQEFCIEMTNHVGFIERLPKKGAIETIQDRLKQNVHIYFPKEVREIRDITINIEPTGEQRKIKQQLVKEYYYEHVVDQKTNSDGEIGNRTSDFEVEVRNAAALLTKLQQISDGFLHDSGGNYISIASNKLRKLIQHCTELFEGGERVLVWFAFKRSIVEASAISPFETVTLSGYDRFDYEKWHSGGTRVCYATVGSGSSLNDFKNTRYSVIYSSSYSHRAMQQARGRTNRRSSSHSCCYYYYFQTVGFPDSRVYKMLEESKTTEEFVIDTTRKIVEDYLKGER